MAFILIFIFLIDSEDLNYVPTAYLKPWARGISRKSVDTFYSIYLFWWWGYVILLSLIAERQLTTSSDPRSSDPRSSEPSSSDLLRQVFLCA